LNFIRHFFIFSFFVQYQFINEKAIKILKIFITDFGDTLRSVVRISRFQLGAQFFQLGHHIFQLGSQIFQLSNRSPKIPSKNPLSDSVWGHSRIYSSRSLLLILATAKILFCW
jgi:hypothetical protein